MTSTAGRLLVAVLILAGIGTGVYVGFDRIKPWFAPAPAPDKAPAVPPVVRVVVPLDGASSQQVEDTLTRPLEQAVSVIGGVQDVQSRSLDGLSIITASFGPGVDMFLVRQQVTNSVLATINGLGEIPGEPRIILGDPEALPVVWLTISAKDPSLAVVSSDAKEVRETLGSLIGRDVQLIGGRSRCLRVRLDLKKVADNRLLVADLTEAIRSNAGANAGRSIPESITALKDLVIVKREPMPLRLRDVAAIEEGTVDDGGYAFLDGRPVVALGVHSLDEAADKTTAAVQGKLPELRAGLGEGEELAVAVDYPAAGAAGMRDEWLVDLTFPAGVGGPKMASLVQDIDRELRQLPAVARVLAVRPDAAATGAAGYDWSLFIRLRPQTDAQRAETLKQLRTTLDGTADARSRWFDLSGQGLAPERRYPFAVIMQGPDRKKVQELAAEVEARLNKEPILIGLASSHKPAVPRLSVTIDREAAARQGIAVKQVQELLTLVRQGIPVGTVRENRPEHPHRDHPILLDIPDIDVAGIRDLPELALRRDDNSAVPLAEITSIQQTSAPPVLLRHQSQPAVYLIADLAAGTTAEQALNRSRELAEQVRKEMKLPDEYRIVPLDRSRSSNAANPQ